MTNFQFVSCNLELIHFYTACLGAWGKLFQGKQGV